VKSAVSRRMDFVLLVEVDAGHESLLIERR
jgi:hypothetical protein